MLALSSPEAQASPRRRHRGNRREKAGRTPDHSGNC